MNPGGDLQRSARIAGSLLLGMIAIVHVAWGAGSSWPARDRKSLARAIIGRDSMPSAVSCYGVAAMILAASFFVAWYPKSSGLAGRFRHAGFTCVVGTLFLRGLAGTYGILPPQRTSESFARWDRRLYTPLCFLLTALCGYGGRRGK